MTFIWGRYLSSVWTLSDQYFFSNCLFLLFSILFLQSLTGYILDLHAFNMFSIIALKCFMLSLSSFLCWLLFNFFIGLLLCSYHHNDLFEQVVSNVAKPKGKMWWGEGYLQDLQMSPLWLIYAWRKKCSNCMWMN